MAKPLEDAYDDPLEVTVSDHDIVLMGPGGIAGSFTVRAAVETAKRLLKAAAEVQAAATETPGGAATEP